NQGSPFSSSTTFAEQQKCSLPPAHRRFRLSLAFHFLPETLHLQVRRALYLIQLPKIFLFVAPSPSFSLPPRMARFPPGHRSMETIRHSHSWPATTRKRGSVHRACHPDPSVLPR